MEMRKFSAQKLKSKRLDMPEGGPSSSTEYPFAKEEEAVVEVEVEEEAVKEEEEEEVPEVEAEDKHAAAALATLFRTQCPFSGLLTMKIFQLHPLLPLLPPYPLSSSYCLPFRFSFWFGSLLFNQ